MVKPRQQLIRELKDQALELARKGEHAQALARFDKLESLEPAEADWPRRAADCHRALSSQSRQIAALGRAAERYAQAGALAKAIAVCKMILALEPQHTETQTRLAALQVQGPSPAMHRPAERTPLKAPLSMLPRTAAPIPEAPAVPDLSHLLRQRRAAQAKRPLTAPAPPATPGPEASPVAAKPPPAPRRRSPEPMAVDATPAMSNQPALPFLAEGSLNELVPGSKRFPDRRGIPSGMFRIEIGDVRAPEPADRAQRAAQQALPVTPLFSELGPASLERLITRARLLHLEPGGVVYRQDEPADALYVIATGAIGTVAEGQERLPLARFSDGEFFGESALIDNEPRQHTAEALEVTDLLAIDRETIRELVSEEPRVLTTVLRFLRERLIESSVLTNPLFTALSRLERRRLAARFDFVEIEPGALVVWQGVRSPGLFVLLSGSAEVLHEDGHEERVLARLRSGEVFGEMSLLRGETAIADVRCLTRSFALMLPKAEFQRVVADYPPVLEFIRLLAEARHRQNVSAHEIQ